MNNRKWVRRVVDGEEISELVDNNGVKYAVIKKTDDGNNWESSVFGLLKIKPITFSSDESLETVEWKTTLAYYNKCNIEATKFQSFRDNLPNISELAKKAGVI